MTVSGGVADDSFSRTVDGWGSAATGAAYTLQGPAADFWVTGGSGRIRVTDGGQRCTAVLGSTSARNVDARVILSTDKAVVGLGQRFSIIARRVDGNTEYRVRAMLAADGTVHLDVVKVVDGVETVLGGDVSVPGLSYAPGDPLALRARLMGASPTTITAKAWSARREEPDVWHLERSDSEASLQAVGATGLQAELLTPTLNAPVTFSVDSLHVASPK